MSFEEQIAKAAEGIIGATKLAIREDRERVTLETEQVRKQVLEAELEQMLLRPGKDAEGRADWLKHNAASLAEERRYHDAVVSAIESGFAKIAEAISKGAR